MSSETVESRTPVDPLNVEHPAPPSPSDRIWFAVLITGLVVAVPVLLWWGRKQWFFLDEWAFLVNRRLTDVPSMLMAHNGHWVTLPAIAYRVLFRTFGLRTYLPYQMLAVVFHVGVIVMVWFTMRRLQVRPAIATTTALPFVLYGAGQQDILFGFQIALTGSIVFGLAQLLLATTEAPTLRRDIAGIAFGLAAIMCSAVGIPMVIGVALAVLIRRGWRAAALHAVPLGAIYVLWYLAYATSETTQDQSLGFGTVQFAWRMAQASFTGLGQNSLVAIALALIGAVGVGWAAQSARRDRHSSMAAIVAALIASALIFALLTAFGRAADRGLEYAASGRFLYVVAALCLPVIALGAELLARHWLVLGAAPVVLLAIGLPANIDLLRYNDPFTLGSREGVTAVAHSPLLAQLPPKLRLFSIDLGPDFAPTVAFLRAAAADGRLPAIHHPSPQARINADAYIALHQRGDRRGPACRPAGATQKVHARRGTRIEFSGTVNVTAERNGVASYVSTFESKNGNTIAVRAGPLDLVITGTLGRPLSICRIVDAQD